MSNTGVGARVVADVHTGTVLAGPVGPHQAALGLTVLVLMDPPWVIRRMAFAPHELYGEAA